MQLADVETLHPTALAFAAAAALPPASRGWSTGPSPATLLLRCFHATTLPATDQMRFARRGCSAPSLLHRRCPSIAEGLLLLLLLCRHQCSAPTSLQGAVSLWPPSPRRPLAPYMHRRAFQPAARITPTVSVTSLLGASCQGLPSLFPMAPSQRSSGMPRVHVLDPLACCSAVRGRPARCPARLTCARATWHTPL